MRGGRPGRRGYLVQFEPRLSQTAATADEWIPIKPGTEGLVALALGRLVAEKLGGALPAAFLEVDSAAAAGASGIRQEELERLASIFANAEYALAIPGGSTLGHSNGLEAAQVILAVNALVGNLGQPGGIFLTADPLQQGVPSAATKTRGIANLRDLHELVSRMREGKIKTLFVHGTNPLFDLPPALGFEAALANVGQVISFASFPDETAHLADYIFPDHTGLESWGYQWGVTGADRAVISGAQPAVAPFHNTKAAADVLLAAAGETGLAAVPYKDEVDFLAASLSPLVTLDGFFKAPEIKTFMAQFQQYGGWWGAQPALEIPATSPILNQSLRLDLPEFEGEGEFILFPFPSPILGDGSGANKPWLQETPDPTTTVMWNSWVEINPDTAEELGIGNDEVVKIISPFGELEAVVYRYPAIRPDTIAIPFGQGHTAYGRYAQGRGANPAQVLGLKMNGASSLACGAIRVKIEKTGKHQPLSRLESRIGVYGEGMEE
jgi:anaerobic selenocysteine-containing dehydrogenase